MHSPGQIVMSTNNPIKSVLRPQKPRTLARVLESAYELLESLMIQEDDGKNFGFNYSKEQENTRLNFNFAELWDKAAYDFAATMDPALQLPNSIQINYAHIDYEQRAAVLVSASHIFVIQYENSPLKKIAQRSYVKNAANILIIPKKFEDFQGSFLSFSKSN